MSKKTASHASHALHFTVCSALFFLLAFALLAFGKPDTTVWILCGAVPGILILGVWVLGKLYPSDALTLSVVHFLCALGVLVLYMLDPGLARRQVIAYALGTFGMVFCAVLICRFRPSGISVWILMALSLLLLGLPLLAGEEINGTRRWVSLGSLSFQPGEIVKLLWVLILARLMSERKIFLWFPFALICLILLILQRDLGTAFIYFAVLLLLFWISSGNVIMTFAGVGAGGIAAFLACQRLPYIHDRIVLWLNPWAEVPDADDQISKGLMAIARGGLFGAGPDAACDLPVGESDFIFAVICNRFGLIVGLCVLLLYAVLILRGVRLAMDARRGFHGLLVMGSVCLIGVQTLLIVGGVLKLLPLTGVTMPFVSYGGTSMVADLCLLGMVQGVASINRKDNRRERI